MNNIVKIAAKGQIQNDTKFGFTFPNKFNPSLPTPADMWLRYVPDPRPDSRPFECQRCYAFWKSPMGNYYALIVPSPDDTRNGKFMITIHTGKYVAKSGHAVLEALHALEGLLVPNYNRDVNDPSVIAVADKLAASLTADKSPARPVAGQTVGYRVYSNNDELAKILKLTDQPAYKSITRLIIIPQAGSITDIPDPRFKKITATLQEKSATSSHVHTASSGSGNSGNKSGSPLLKIVATIAVLAGLYFGTAAALHYVANVHLFPFGETSEEVDKQTASNKDTKDSSQDVDNPKLANNKQEQGGKANTKQELKESPDEAKDIEYMLHSNTWAENNIHSQKYKVLYQHLTEGNIEEILSNDWFPEGKNNSVWTEITSKLRRVSPEMKVEISGEMKRLGRSGSINLEELRSSINIIHNRAKNNVSKPNNDAAKKTDGKNTKTDGKTKASDKSNTAPSKSKASDNKKTAKGDSKTAAPKVKANSSSTSAPSAGRQNSGLN